MGNTTSDLQQATDDVQQEVEQQAAAQEVRARERAGEAHMHACWTRRCCGTAPLACAAQHSIGLSLHTCVAA
jgi:hypothetical protein